MIPSPIHKALSIFQNCSARFLLMGGQACILYGAAEFSRDLDLAIGVDEPELGRIRKALEELAAERVFLPSLDAEALRRGHACHFRCHAGETEGLRIDLMTRMRGCDDFGALWERRTMVQLPELGVMGVLSLPDLVKAKKTQREKDWPMIRRLIEKARPDLCRAAAERRKLLDCALSGDAAALESGLREEESSEKELDRRYWGPLRLELEKWRHEGGTPS